MHRRVAERRDVRRERRVDAIDERVRLGNRQVRIDGDVQVGVDLVAEPARPRP